MLPSFQDPTAAMAMASQCVRRFVHRVHAHVQSVREQKKADMQVRGMWRCHAYVYAEFGCSSATAHTRPCVPEGMGAARAAIAGDRRADVGAKA